jgi:hypothetical protein
MQHCTVVGVTNDATTAADIQSRDHGDSSVSITFIPREQLALANVILAFPPPRLSNLSNAHQNVCMLAFGTRKNSFSEMSLRDDLGQKQ